MSEWKETELRKHIIHKKGFAFKSSMYQESGRLIVRVSDTTMNSVNVNSCVKIDESLALQFKDYELEVDDIVIMTVGSWPDNPTSVVGKVIRIPKQAEGALLNQNSVRIRTNNSIDKHFLYYKLKSNDFSGYIENTAQGSANQASITLEDIFNYKFLLPSPNEQKAISNVLKIIDDKIDLLNRQNSTLEKMAETLFRQWFVEESNEEWEVIKLGSILDIINGVSYKSDDLNSSKTAMVTLKSFDRNGGFRMDGFKEYTGKYKEQHILKEGDLVVAHTDITQEADVIGNPVMVIANPKYDTIIFSMDLVKVISKDENYSNEFLYLLMKSKEFKEHCLGYSNGSTVLHLSKKAIPEYEMRLPPNKLINEFSINVKPLVQKQFRNQTQIRTLTSLRNTLLPKLMNREVIIEP